MSFYTETMVERTPDYTLYLRKPNFTPRKAGQAEGTAPKMPVSGGAGNKSGVAALTQEQRAGLLERLHQGRGDLSPQEWDDFLADLVDMDVISNDERYLTNGFLTAVPDEALRGGFLSGGGVQSVHDRVDAWDGDPLKLLEGLDLHLFKQSLYAQLDGAASNTSGQRAACQKVAQIVRDLLNRM